MKRRDFVKLIAVGSFFPMQALSKLEDSKLILKNIPKSGEKIAPIGMGSSRTFNVGSSQILRDQRTRVLKTFFDLGGKVIDSSPMYGSSEEVIGYALKKLSQKEFFSATKVWTSDLEEGKEQFLESAKYWDEKPIDLYQIHNLVNWQEHFKILKKYKTEGKIKYIGITTSHRRRVSEFQEIMKTQDIDFVQFTYNLEERWHEKETLAIAKDKGIATMINRPFQRGDLFDKVKGKALPNFAKEIQCENWAQYFLKWLIAHPSVSSVIPATSKVKHMKENMGALYGDLPDEKMRREMLKYFKAL